MSQIRDRLVQDHLEMHEHLRRLAEDAEAPSTAELEASWDALEARLLRHMEAEERHLLPLLEASHPAEVARTRAEHERIGALVTSLGIAVELHTARKHDILRLVELLNAHSAYEDMTLYPLAGTDASGTLDDLERAKA